jgi:nitrogen fixation/metabolism regulation signal transduction histidine kinase
MFKDRFSVMVILRVVLIFATCMVLAFLFARTDYLFSQIIFLFLLLIQVFSLISYVRRTTRELSKFFNAMKFEDRTITFRDDKLGKEFSELRNSFKHIIQSFRKVKIEKETQFQLLQAVIDRIRLGIITSDQDGEILLMNRSAREFLGITRAGRWEIIQKQVPEFSDAVMKLGSEGKTIVETSNKNDDVQLLVGVQKIILMEKVCKIISFQDIRSEIEQKEMEAWYKMVRILTHEIMNSVTPLGSLTDTILMLLEDNGRQKTLDQITEEQILDVRDSVKTIQKRSEGILHFVEDYRKLTDIPHPEFGNVMVKELFNGMWHLMKTEIDIRGIRMEMEIVPENILIRADRHLLEQVLINLISNSIYALEGKKEPWIRVSAVAHEHEKVISVVDNGKGIEKSKIDKVFIPFYSTREGGSGIGLSFSKHVVYLHHGKISVESEGGSGTLVKIKLPEM